MAGMGVVPGMERFPRLNLYLGLLLAAVTIAVFGQVLGHQFIVYDDVAYVTDNCHVLHGPSRANVAWAFTSFHAGNWHPITWISHMLDCRLFGLNPFGHHFTSLFLHLANVLFLFALLTRMTGSPWKSAFVAGVFGIHPLHIESVAWVAERKDLLCAFFGLVTLHAYVRYTQVKSQARGARCTAYACVIIAFTLTLMCKPMLVTLPFVMLLLDYWPLHRFGKRDDVTHTRPVGLPSRVNSDSVVKVFAEKLPLLVLSGISCVLTYLAQQKQCAVGSWNDLPLAYRMSNALRSYVAYICKAIWPRDVAVFYPHPGGGIAVWQVVASSVLLVVATTMILRNAWSARPRPYLVVGWLWYLGTLVPSIGIIQVGSQAMADRYTYVSLIGLIIMLAWGLPDVFQVRIRSEGRAVVRDGRARVCTPSIFGLGIAGLIAVMGLASCGYIQTKYWRNSIVLFQRALAVTGPNAVAHNCLGSALEAEHRFQEARAHFLRALEIRPDYAEAHYHLGVVLHRQGMLDEAMLEYKKAAEINPLIAEVYVNMGAICFKKHRLEEAIAHYCHAIRINPQEPRAYRNLAVALYVKGDYAGAWEKVRRCRELGGEVHPHLVRALAASLPESGR